MNKWLNKIGLVLFLFPMLITAQNKKEALPPVKLEYVRMNVADKEATAQWYADHVDLEIIPSDNDAFIYIADKDHNFMLELSSIPNIRNAYTDVDVNGFHLAFEGHKTIEQVSEKMLANGGTQVGKTYRNKIGDFVINVRDPNGMVAQLIHRVKPFFPKPEKSSIRFEHFAFNTTDQKTAALWYVEFMDLVIPWSKDIDKVTLKRSYRVPYVADTGSNMSLELFGKDFECSLFNQPHDVIHIGFAASAPEKLAERMVYGGARQLGAVRTEENGDIIVDLFDPMGVPIRLIKRNTAILKK